MNKVVTGQQKETHFNELILNTFTPTPCTTSEERRTTTPWFWTRTEKEEGDDRSKASMVEDDTGSRVGSWNRPGQRKWSVTSGFENPRSLGGSNRRSRDPNLYTRGYVPMRDSRMRVPVNLKLPGIRYPSLIE